MSANRLPYLLTSVPAELEHPSQTPPSIGMLVDVAAELPMPQHNSVVLAHATMYGAVRQNRVALHGQHIPQHLSFETGPIRSPKTNTRPVSPYEKPRPVPKASSSSRTDNEVRDNDEEAGSGQSENCKDGTSGDESHGESAPQGEAGRPGRGGYNLLSSLKWHKPMFVKVKVSSIPSRSC